MEEKAVGAVKWWNSGKGYGFVVLNGEDVFVHYANVVRTDLVTKHVNLEEGQRVRFILREGPKGKFAEGVEAV